MTAPVADAPDGGAPAPWALRAAALALDLAPGAAVVVTALLVGLSVPRHSSWWVGCVALGAAAAIYTAVNRVVLPIMGGRSLGRAVFGIAVVRRGGEPAGSWRLALREIAHVLDTAPLLLGWLWPLWDARRRTFSDMLLRTEARVDRRPVADAGPRRVAAAAMLTAASLCVSGAAISYTVVHRRDNAVAAAGAQIAAQGPGLVAQMLSYRPETIQRDFDHARSLATDSYRAKLSALQRSALKADPQPNEYWVTHSAVLSAGPRRATMLLFLQGRRGTPPGQRYLATSVRAGFVKSGSAGWRVDELTVVTEPQPVGIQP